MRRTGHLQVGRAAVMSDVAAYVALFLSALASATLIPGQSEAALVGMLVANYPAAVLLVVASAGNILGSVINWGVGRGTSDFVIAAGFRCRRRCWRVLNAGMRGTASGPCF